MSRILYVDDEEPLVFLVTRLLQRLGHEPLGFTHPDDALEAFKSNPGQFALVLTDLSMPGSKNGLDFKSFVAVTHAQPMSATRYRPAGSIVSCNVEVILEENADL